MPLSNDNQDYGKKDEQNQQSQAGNSKMTTDDLKGKQQVDADVDNEKDKAIEQDTGKQ